VTSTTGTGPPDASPYHPPSSPSQHPPSQSPHALTPPWPAHVLPLHPPLRAQLARDKSRRAFKQSSDFDEAQVVRRQQFSQHHCDAGGRPRRLAEWRAITGCLLSSGFSSSLRIRVCFPPVAPHPGTPRSTVPTNPFFPCCACIDVSLIVRQRKHKR